MFTSHMEYTKPGSHWKWGVPGIPPGPCPDEPLPTPGHDQPGEKSPIPVPDDTDINSEHRPLIEPPPEDPENTPKDPPVNPDEPHAPLIAGSPIHTKERRCHFNA